MAFKKSAAKGLVTIPEFVETPPEMNIPRHRWFMKVYLLDVISRLHYQLAELTSVTGDILKNDSTKKLQLLVSYKCTFLANATYMYMYILLCDF